MFDNLPQETTIFVTNLNGSPIRCGDVTLMPNVRVEVPLSFLALYGGVPGLSVDFSVIADNMRARTDDGRPYFDYWAPLSMVDGYGRHAIDLWRGLTALGADAVLRTSGGRFLDKAYLPDAIMEQYRANTLRPPARVGLAFSVPYDPKLAGHDSPVKIALTQFETDRVPRRHVDTVNRCNHLIVTTSWQPSIWRKSGVRIPISVMTPGVDTDAFPYIDRPPRSTFNVLLLGALSARKNAGAAVRIFQAASQGNPDWRLTVKSRGELGREVRELARDDRRIQIIFGDVSPDRVVQLYADHDCLLWPSKGEGTGLPPLEAMSTGMEVVSSFNTGMMDYLREDWSYPVKCREKVPAGAVGETFSHDYVSEFGDVGSYWLPDENHAVKQLSKCFDNWLDGKGKGRKAAEYVRACHTLRHQAESVLRVVEEYL